MFCSILIVVDLKHWKRIMSDDAIQYGDNLKVINDLPEREVNLIQALRGGKKERKKKKKAMRYLLQVVMEHWINFPYAKMSLPIKESLKKTFYNYSFFMDMSNHI